MRKRDERPGIKGRAKGGKNKQILEEMGTVLSKGMIIWTEEEGWCQ